MEQDDNTHSTVAAFDFDPFEARVTLFTKIYFFHVMEEPAFRTRGCILYLKLI